MGRKPADLIEEPVSGFHQGQKLSKDSHKVRMYDCNLYLLAVMK